MNQGDLYTEKNDMENAMKEYNAAMKMFPDNLEMKYWTAITLANNKQVNKAIPMLKAIYEKNANWRELTRRLPKVGLLTVTEAVLKSMLQ
jgi:predicted Zn-dependent protease